MTPTYIKGLVISSLECVRGWLEQCKKKEGWGAGKLPQSLGENKYKLWEKKPMKDERKEKVSAGIFAVVTGTQSTDGGSCLTESLTHIPLQKAFHMDYLSHRISVDSLDKLSGIPNPRLFHANCLIYLQILFIFQTLCSCIHKQMGGTPAKTWYEQDDDNKMKKSPQRAVQCLILLQIPTLVPWSTWVLVHVLRMVSSKEMEDNGIS